MRLFLDTNILLDVIEARPGLLDESTEVLVRADQLEARLFIAWHSLATIYYLIRRGRSEQETMEEIDQVLAWADVAPVSASSATRARLLASVAALAMAWLPSVVNATTPRQIKARTFSGFCSRFR